MAGLRSRGDANSSWTAKAVTSSAAEAEQQCRNQLSDAFVNHSYRTWLFGSALARFDGVDLNPELLFVVSMLHDIGLASGTFRCCFTATGADFATSIGSRFDLGRTDLETMAAAITHHITPNLNMEEGDVHGLYLQQGSLCDLAGTRLAERPRNFDLTVPNMYPLETIKRETGSRWKAEAAVVRHGRAHHLQRWTRFSFASRITPLPPRPVWPKRFFP